jgi:hypothetical protein
MKIVALGWAEGQVAPDGKWVSLRVMIKPGHTKDLCVLCESFVSFAVKALIRKGRGAYARGAK